MVLAHFHRFTSHVMASVVAILMVPDPAFSQTVSGLHASYVSTNPHMAKTFESTKKMMSDMCAQLLKKPFTVSGSASQVETASIEQYFSHDGALMAEYQDGYLAKPVGQCSLVVEPYKKILIYHIKQRLLYRFNNSGKPPFWNKSTLPGMGAAGFTINALNAQNAAKGIKPSATHKASFLSRLCDVNFVSYGGGSFSSCEWDPSVEGANFPARLSLYAEMKDANGDLIMETVVKAIDAKASIPAHLFQPPGGAFK